MFCLLVVLVKLSVLAKWLARKTPLKKPNRGEGIVSRKPRPKSACDFLGLLYCFIVLLCIYVVSCPYVIYYPTVLARYRLFVLKVALNPKQTNKRTKQTGLDVGQLRWSRRTRYRYSKPPTVETVEYLTAAGSDGVKDMTRKAKAKAKDLTCHAALKPQTLYTVQC